LARLTDLAMAWQVGSASSGAVWLYSLTYGGGIVSVSLLSRSLRSLFSQGTNWWCL
jgi:hypothetical protein